jgi:hypothetical protein
MEARVTRSLPFGARDAVVKQRLSRHSGLEVTVAAPKRGPRFRAYLHLPDWQRVLAVSTGDSPDAAITRVEELLRHATGSGVRVNLPPQRRHQGSSGAAAS